MIGMIFSGKLVCFQLNSDTVSSLCVWGMTWRRPLPTTLWPVLRCAPILKIRSEFDQNSRLSIKRVLPRRAAPNATIGTGAPCGAGASRSLRRRTVR